MNKKTDTTILTQLAHRPMLERALGSYAYAMEHVTGGSSSHAGAIQARDAVEAALPVGADVADVIASYMTGRDESGIAARNLRRGDLLSWGGFAGLVISSVDRLGDGTVRIYAGPYGADLPPLTFACGTRVYATRDRKAVAR